MKDATEERKDSIERAAERARRAQTMHDYVNAQREIDELFGVAPRPAEFQSQT